MREDNISMRNPSLEFGASEKQGVYDAIYKRRDVRGQFLPDPVPDALLYKLLDAAHHTGSVGFMQPWSFIIIRSQDMKGQVKKIFEEANEAASKVFEGRNGSFTRA
jgi:5,6-dimethylbenzimidazole synthase